MALDKSSAQPLLEKKGQELQNMIDGLDVAVFLIEEGFKIVRLNYPALQLTHQKSYQDILGQKCHKIFFGSENACSFCPIKEKSESFKNLFENEFRFRQEVSIKREEDHTVERKIYSQKQYFIQTFNHYFFLVEFLADITEEKAKEELHLRNSKLISLGTAVHTVIHSLWNPLTGMRLTVESIKDDVKNIAQKTKLLKQDIEKASTLILDLFGFLKKRGYSLSKIKIKKIIEDSYESLHSHKPAPLKLSWNWLCADDIEIRGHESRLKIMLDNIFENSFYAFNEKQIAHPIIWIGCKIIKKPMKHLKHHAEYLKIQIIDNAGGIPERILRRIFDPFFTTKKKQTNTGMGLAIANKVMGEHSGVIEADSIGQRTQFILYFPIDSQLKHNYG